MHLHEFVLHSQYEFALMLKHIPHIFIICSLKSFDFPFVVSDKIKRLLRRERFGNIFEVEDIQNT